jgi:G3E family GTPase
MGSQSLARPMNTSQETEDACAPHVILVAGGVGAGKSELIRHLVRNGGGHRVASLQAAAPTQWLFPRLGGGPTMNPYDHLLIELPPAADPRDFIDSAEPGAGSGTSARQTVVCVVNAETVLADFCSHDLMRSRIAGLALDDIRSLADVLTDQIEVAQVLVLNKTDRMSLSQKQGLIALLTVLNPEAWLTQTEYGRVPLPLVLGQQSLARRLRAITPGWKRALNGAAFPDADAHRISSLLYRERRPFHPQRLREFLGESWPGVVRSRGVFWIASRPDQAAELSQAGAARRYRAVSTWWAATLEGRNYAAGDVSDFLGVRWDPDFGDRRQEIIFVGIGLDAEALKERVDACLLTDDELRGGQARWQLLDDPFPMWPEVARAVRFLH